MSPFSYLFISKNRKVNFEISVIIRDLVNVPLVSGYYYINWKLKHASHRTGSTPRLVFTVDDDNQITFLLVYL